MKRSTLPIGLLGVTSFASVYQVRSPHVRKRNGPKERSRLTLLALSVVSSGCGRFSPAKGLGSPELARTSPLAVTVFISSGVFPERKGSLSPTFSVFDLFWVAAR